MNSGQEFKGVCVEINKSKNYPTPFGLNYCAKGCYINGKNMIIVGEIHSNSTVRVKYPMEDVKVKWLLEHEIPEKTT